MEIKKPACSTKTSQRRHVINIIIIFKPHLYRLVYRLIMLPDLYILKDRRFYLIDKERTNRPAGICRRSFEHPSVTRVEIAPATSIIAIED